jgi:hypothetical protein
MAEKPITAAEARLLASACNEWPKGNGAATRTIKGEPIFELENVTSRNAKFGYPPIQLARWRKGVKQRLQEIVNLVEDTYYNGTGERFDYDITFRPRTVAKFFSRYAKQLEKKNV